MSEGHWILVLEAHVAFKTSGLNNVESVRCFTLLISSSHITGSEAMKTSKVKLKCVNGCSKRYIKNCTRL